MLDRGPDNDRHLDVGQTVVQAVSSPATDPTALMSAVCRDGLAFWRALDSGGRLDGGRPRRDKSAVDPAAMRTLLPYTFMVDVLDAGRAFRYRLVGTNIVAHTPRDNTGLLLSDIASQGTQARLRDLYASVVRDGAPRFQRIPYRTRLGLRSWYETVVCPLSDRAAGVEIGVLIGWAEHFHQPIEERAG